MALDAVCLEFLCRAIAPSARSIVTLGVQELTFGLEDLERLSGRIPALAGALQAGREGRLDQERLFRSLGLETVETLDVSGAESPTHLLDLNRPLPARLFSRFDVVLDGGTLEHVFDVRQCMENIARLVRPGGLALHINPVNNAVDHGFYQFSPTFFFDWYPANGFAGVQVALESGGGFFTLDEHSYVPPCARLFARRSCQSYVSARKQREVEAFAIPTQRAYSRRGDPDLGALLAGRSVMVWGSGGRFVERYRDWFAANGELCRFLGFLDNDPARQGGLAHGRPVYGPERLLMGDVDDVLIASCAQEAIAEQIYALGLPVRVLC